MQSKLSPTSSAVCPACKGRGWIQPSDPDKFPELCACKKAPPAPPPASAPTAGQRVGASVLAACRAAGLTAEWSGRPEDFVELPQLRWQRRITPCSEQDVRDFLESWQLELRAGYTKGEPLELLEARAADWFDQLTDYGPRVQQRLQAQTAQIIQDERAREEGWSGATLNDRISAVFAQLDARGVLARECLGLTIEDGWAYAGVQAGPGTRGAVFFHHEDVIDGVEGRGLLLAFGALGCAPADEPAASAALAREIVAALLASGVPASWSGALEERIRVAPFEWQRRRWTSPPAFAPQSVAPAEPKRRSLIARLFGAKDPAPAAPLDPRANEVARQRPLVVRTLIDERGFNLRRSRSIRESWKALGLAGEAQVAHRGAPHAFVPARGHTSFVPRRSIENLRAEKDKAFARGAAARAGAEK